MTAAVTGLTANTTYHFRISATNAGGTSKGSDLTLKTLANAPTVETKAASALTQTTATLNATVNPNGGEVTDCKFEYGTTESYGSTASCASLPGSGNSPVAVSAAVTGLTANTTYHFRISATNTGGTIKGSDVFAQNAPQRPDGRDRGGVARHTDDRDAERDGQSQRRRSHRLQIRIRHDGSLRIDRLVRLAAGVRQQPGRGVRGGDGPHSEHHLPLQDLGDQRRRHEQRLRPDAQNAAERSDGRDRSGVARSTQTTATLNATVNPNSGNVTDCKFEYGTTKPTDRPQRAPRCRGPGAVPVAVTAAVTGLAANTTYHFRISATNAGGTSKGSDLTLKTPPNAPAVVTKAASSVAPTTATLNATVNPEGATVSDCKFEYGTTETYGSTASCASLPGSGTSPVAVSAAVTGLTPNTTYHFRISATNPSGTSKGSDLTLKTVTNAPTVVTEGASAITADLGDAERDREPQQRRSHGLQIRSRRN